jgi:hypothetical protein
MEMEQMSFVYARMEVKAHGVSTTDNFDSPINRRSTIMAL